MGTVVTIDVYTTDGTAGTGLSRQLATARAILQRADAVFSTWQPHSPVEALDGYEALIIALDGSRRWTEHFPFAPCEAAPPR